MAGMQVTVIGFPEIDRNVWAKDVAYVSIVGRLSPRGKSLIDLCRRMLGKLWIVVFENIAVYFYALRYAKATRADVVFVNDVESWIVVLLSWLGRLRKAPPVVGFIPSGFDVLPGMKLALHARIRAWLIHRSMPLLPQLICVVCDNAINARRIFPSQASMIRIVPEGFDAQDVSLVEKAEARCRLDLPVNKRILLLFGMDLVGRGADLLYEALRGVDRSFMVCVVGKIARLYAPMNADVNNGWDANVRRVYGYVSDEERLLYFNACDAVILPFRHGFSTTSQCLRDAISCGKALLASDQYVIGETVKTNAIGLTFPPEDIRAMRMCLQTFAIQPQEWFDQIGINCHSIVSKYSWERIAEQYRNVFEAAAVKYY